MMVKKDGTSGEASAQKALERILAAWDAQKAAEQDAKTASSEHLAAGKEALEHLGDLISDNRGAVNDGRAEAVLGEIVGAWDERATKIAEALTRKQAAKATADEARKAFEESIASTKQGELAL
jgi:F0F1-type ATP synthase membrane subunit b/b'